MVADQAAAAGAAGRTVPPYARDAVAVVETAGSDADSGLTQTEVASRLSTYGTNQIASEKPPSVWAVALLQLRDPMNIMLVAVAVVSLLIGQVSTGVIVALLILLNVALGTRQELKARASVDALAKMQVPQARVVRDGDGRAGRRPPRSFPATSCRSRPGTSCPPTAGSSGPRRWRRRRPR